MSFFNNHISDSYGKKCCRYNQNGEPLSEAKAQKIFASASKVLTGWKLAEAGRKLVRKYYA